MHDDVFRKLAMFRIGDRMVATPSVHERHWTAKYGEEGVAGQAAYDADLEQVTVKKLDDSLGSTPALLLTGQVNIEEKYNLEDQGGEDGINWVKLLPKDEESGFKYILIGLNKGQLGGMELSDNFGQITRIYFNNIQLNPTLNDTMFNFTPPKNADVFEN